MPDDLVGLTALMPLASHLGIVVEEAGPDQVVARLDWAPHLCTAGGVLHGGTLMALTDSAGAVLAYLGLPPGATTATLTSTTQLFRPVTGGTVRATAVALHRGRATVTVQTSVFDADDRLVAQTTQIQAIRQPG